VYQTVSPECAALLEPAIRCVAPVYASGALTPCWLGECYPELAALASGCYGLKEQLAAARARWQATGVVDYRLRYDLRADEKAEIVVLGGLVTAVTPADAFAWTVPLLFDLVDHDLVQPGGIPRVTYDADLGYVVESSRLERCSHNVPLVSGVEVAPLR
jgi:hypothetical protein